MTFLGSVGHSLCCIFFLDNTLFKNIIKYIMLFYILFDILTLYLYYQIVIEILKKKILSSQAMQKQIEI